MKFEKETISRLDEQQMNEIQGGSSYFCVTGGIILATNIINRGVDDSWWACYSWNCGGGGDCTGNNSCDVCIA
ncbi:MAG: class I lanthipeptide [Salinivirgaceae bacterium]|nr:class I lanthipeptide [Salinivirgaceae bacterium]